MTQTTLGYSDLYQLPDELLEFRSAVRTLAEDRICLRASEIDRTGAYPWDIRRPVAHERDYRVGQTASTSAGSWFRRPAPGSDEAPRIRPPCPRRGAPRR